MKLSSSSQSGMSLVEVLVALFILALASAAIVMTLPRQPSGLDRELARLEDAIERISDEAISSGELRAIHLTAQGYQSQSWANGDWVAMARSNHRLPSSIQLAVRKGRDDRKDWPAIVADPTGMVSGRPLTLREGTAVRTINVSAAGQVRVER